MRRLSRFAAMAAVTAIAACSGANGNEQASQSRTSVQSDSSASTRTSAARAGQANNQPRQPSPPPRITAGQCPAHDPAGAASELDRLREAQQRALATEWPDFDGKVTNAVDPAGWLELVVDIGRLRALNPLRTARLASMAAVAMQRALDCVSREPAAPGARPLDGDPEFDNADLAAVTGAIESGARVAMPASVATAAAAAAVVGSLYPSDAPRASEGLNQTVRVELLQGRYWPSEIESAKDLGRAIGEAVVAERANDGAGSSSPPAQSAPAANTSGWVPTPPIFAPALEPSAGSWVTWYGLGRSITQLPAPPSVDSPELEAALDQLVDLRVEQTDGQRRAIEIWDLGPGSVTPVGSWIQSTANLMHEQQTPIELQTPTLAALTTTLFDTGVAVWANKYEYMYPRPITLIRARRASDWSPSLVTPNFPSYPSGHAAFSSAAATVLASLWPERAADFVAGAAEAADSRALAGIHYWFDDTAGVELGSAVAAEVLKEWNQPSTLEDDTILDAMDLTRADARPGDKPPDK